MIQKLESKQYNVTLKVYDLFRLSRTCLEGDWITLHEYLHMEKKYSNTWKLFALKVHKKSNNWKLKFDAFSVREGNSILE